MSFESAKGGQVLNGRKIEENQAKL